jgi:hypothetical protein
LELVGALRSPKQQQKAMEEVWGESLAKRTRTQKGLQWASDKPLPETGQVAVHKAHLPSQWATPKVKQHCKIEKQSANHHNTLTTGAGWWITHLAPEKGGKAKKQTPSKPTQWKSNSKAGWLVGYRAHLQNLRTTCKLKLPNLTEGGAD